MTKRSTSTSKFGVSRRESHDASGFYRRFEAPVLSGDSEVASGGVVDRLIAGDARHMDAVADSSVALVVTSPPYFAGKEYEEALGEGGVPGSYLEYLQLLREVFAECVRKLEPGGRIAVNVANLGRRPYRSLSADVTAILQDDLRLLLRGEIIWVKQRGSSGSCAWGSFQRPGNPVLRDLTERVVVASKGRFDRAVPAKARQQRGLPSVSSMTREDFMENTLDLWEIPAESASRVGHPAPFPVELPSRLIHLYTYRGDLVVDPFAGSGSTAVAAVRSDRHYVGYDLDASYIELAESRVAKERLRLEGSRLEGLGSNGPAIDGESGAFVDATPLPPGGTGFDLAELIRAGLAGKDIARAVLEEAEFEGIKPAPRQAGGLEVSFSAIDRNGRQWLFDVAGTFTTHRGGLRRSDALWKAVGKASVLHASGAGPLVVLTCGLPGRGAGRDVLESVIGPGKPIVALIDLMDANAAARLRSLVTEVSERQSSRAAGAAGH